MSNAKAAEGLNRSLNLAFDKKQIRSIVSGTVKEVDGYNTCTVELEPGLELYDVRLNAINAGLNSQCTIKPAVGSKVLVGIIENVKTQAVLLACSEVEELYTKIGTAVLRVKESKIKIEAEGENLKDVISDFFDEVMKIEVLYGRTPNVPALTAIKQRFVKILD